MLQFNKKENNQEIDLIKVVSLLIHAAKIDEKYTDEERRLIKDFILKISEMLFLFRPGGCCLLNLKIRMLILKIRLLA